jgi:flavin-dependent dehydrogenase
MPKDFDVVIVGARCAGAATGLLLARAGARVLIVDKGSYGSDTLSTHALMRGAVMQLNRWGVLPRVLRSAPPPVRTTTFGYPDARVDVPIEPRFGVDALYAPRRTVLDRALVDEARTAGAQVSYRTHLSDVLWQGNGRLTGVTLTTTQGEQQVHADLVIGADGLHSRFARLVGATRLASSVHMTATLYSYWQDFAAAGYEWHYEDSASVGAIPTNDGLTCVFLAIPAHLLAATTTRTATERYEHVLRTRFAPIAHRLDGARRVEPVRGFGGHPGFMKDSGGDGWALVGDAGYFKDPLTAHGITDALRDAELLTRAILAGTAEALANYTTTRHDLSHRLFEITDRIASFAWTSSELQSLHRAFSREMSREQRALDDLEPFAWQLPSANVPLAV